MSELHSKKRKQTSVRFETDFYDEVETYQKDHNIKTWNNALYLRDKENLQRIEELTSEKKKAQSIFDYLHKEKSEDTPLDKNMSIPTSTELSEKACNALGHKKNGEPFCIDPTAPISTQARRYFNHEVCQFCQRKRNKQFNEAQKKQEKDIKTFHEQKKREVHELQQRVNQNIAGQRKMRNGGSGKDYFTNEYGQRISY